MELTRRAPNESPEPLQDLLSGNAIGSLEEIVRLSRHRRRELFAEELMGHTLEPERITRLMCLCFPTKPRQHVLAALKLAFRSTHPLKTAGCFYRNSIQVFPDIRRTILRGLTQMFTNMILGEGHTGIVIRSQEA